MVYAISGNALFKYSSSSNSYSSIQVLDSFTAYKVKNYANEIVAWGYSNTGASPGSYTVTQKIYAMYDVNDAITTVRTWSLTAHDNVATDVPVQISPFFTKINYEYYANAGNSTKSAFFYNIDF